jgi:LuxR family maltose regulon positive regulatory protein
MGDVGGLTAKSSVLRAKLRTPALPPHYVRRSRLIEFVDEVARAPLTVVVAPAGAGKTSLLTGWIAERTEPCAWLALDQSDCDAAAFWVGVICALETFCAGCGDGARVSLRERRSVVDAVAQLLDDLEPDGTEVDHAECTLVIDDLHYADESAATTEALCLFLSHLPVWLHVVLVSRRAPDLPLDRWRARGLLGEVLFAELRFSHAEATDLLHRLAPSLSEEQVHATALHADGLAVSLQMAALDARSARVHEGDSRSTADGDALVHGYVIHEVLAAEEPDLIDTLLDVSVVARVNPGLAAQLTGRSDADEMLRRAAGRGLFVTAIDSAGWFELHSVARVALLAELERRAPQRVAEQHLRAARWFEGADEIALALEHYLLAGRAREALRLLASKHAELYDAGLEDTMARVLDAIPAEVASADLEAMLELPRCYRLINRERFLEAVEQAAFWAEQSPPLEPLIEARLAIVQSMAAVEDGRIHECRDYARAARDLFGDDWWRDPFGRFTWNLIAHELALSERWDDSADDVRAARLLLSREPDRRIAFEATAAMGAVMAGRPLDALKRVSAVRRLAAVVDKKVMRAEIGIAEALAHRELGDRSRSAAELNAIADAPVGPMLFCKIRALVELAQAFLDDGSTSSAADVLARARGIVDTESFGPLGRSWVTALETRLALAEGRVHDAHELALRVADPFWKGVSIARVALTEGDRTDALDALGLAEARCPRHEVIRDLLRARSVEDHDEALKLAAGAVELAAGLGMLQTVASEGHEAVELVERVAWCAPAEWLERLHRAPVSSPLVANPRFDLVDPLTERELEVLRFLPSRLTIREIANELFVSVNTLKFHLRMIYRKLGVGSRVDAVQRARELSLSRGHHSR